MITPAQLAANRANAQSSTGPRTPAGKTKSAMNAARHGLTARRVVLHGEDMEEYLRLSAAVAENYHPETFEEKQLVQTLADCQWRLDRALAIEDGMLSLHHYFNAVNAEPDDDQLNRALTDAICFRDCSREFLNLTLYEQRLQRSVALARKRLDELRVSRFKRDHTIAATEFFARQRREQEAARLQSEQPQPEPEQSAQPEPPLPDAPPAEIGFVYATPFLVVQPHPFEPEAFAYDDEYGEFLPPESEENAA